MLCRNHRRVERDIAAAAYRAADQWCDENLHKSTAAV